MYGWGRCAQAHEYVGLIKDNADDTSEIKQGADQTFYNVLTHNYISLNNSKTLLTLKLNVPYFMDYQKFTSLIYR